MRSLKCFLLVIVLAGLAIVSSGCTAMVHDSVFEDLPNTVDILKSAPPLADDMSRVVLYYPRDVAIGILGPGGFASKPIKLQGQAGYISFPVMDQSGYYVDVPGGDYTFAKAPDKKLTFKNGSVYYVKVGKEKPGLSLNSLGGIKPTLMDTATGLSELAEYNIKSDPPIINFQMALIPNKREKSKLVAQLTDMSVESLGKKIEREPIAPELSRLYLINNAGFMGGGGKIQVGIDGTPNTVKLGRKKYMCIDLAPGSHTFCTQLSAFGIEPAPPKFLLKFNVEKGVNSYLVYEIKTGIAFRSAEESRKLVKKHELIEGGYYLLEK